MASVFEVIMLICFGCSWPINVLKSYKAGTTKGKSILFLCFIFIGYMFGIAAKLISGNFEVYVIIFYILNSLMVFADILMYFRNLKLDRASVTKECAK